MIKLLTTYRLAPTLKNALKVRAYDRSHMMARVMLMPADIIDLDAAIAHADRGE
jgi:hypothetical protein